MPIKKKPKSKKKQFSKKTIVAKKKNMIKTTTKKKSLTKKPTKTTKKLTQSKSSSSSIEFCKKCSSIMMPDKKGKNIYLKCRSCGYLMRKNIRSMKITERKKPTEKVIILEKNEIMLPITDRECFNCNNNKAYYWLQQTRSADEPPTQFFKCTKCKRVWREYK